MSQLPAEKECLETFSKPKQMTQCVLIQFCHNGWPARHAVKGEVLHYWPARENFTVCEGLHTSVWHMHCGTREAAKPNPVQDSSWPSRNRMIPTSSDHLRVVARSFLTNGNICTPVFYLCMSTSSCEGTYATTQVSLKKVASDLFELKGKQYFLVVDYYSCYPEVIRITTTTSASVRSSLKCTMVSDNGTQYNSAKMKEFASSYGFNHVTGSPHYPQCIGLAE